MMKKKLLFIVGLGLSTSLLAQTDINDARTNFATGQTVTIRGVVTNGGELGGIRYIQDASGAIPAYGSPASNYDRGDSIEVTGVLKDYNGLLEIDPVSSATSLGVAVAPPSPLVVTIPNMVEANEGKLIQIDNVTISSTGNFAGNTNYTFTDGTNTGELRVNNNSNLVGTAIPTGAVSIVAVLSQYTTTYQLLPRDVNDIFAFTPPSKEIEISIYGANFISGSQLNIGTIASINVKIKNLGASQALAISSGVFTGTNAADFSTSVMPASIPAGDSATFQILFAPTGNGTRTATLAIGNDDSDENPFIINLYGIGNDGIATEPAINVSNLTFPIVEAYAITGTFTGDVATESYIVLWSKTATPSQVPVDGTTYDRGDIIGNSTIAYVGSGTSFAPRHILANSDYYFAVFPFNGHNGFENYKTDAPLTGNVTSLGLQIGTYYNGITLGTSFTADLHALINPHTVISYGNYKATVMNQFEVRDTVDGQSAVTCSYSGEIKVFSGAFDWTVLGYSREHTYCHSWMPSYPADNYPNAKPEYSDQHNLYPVNQNKANAVRSNYPLGIITGNVTSQYLEGKLGIGPGNQIVYEPRDAHKGNAARAIMYMAVAYNTVAGNNWHIPTYQDQYVLKQWNDQDLPDNYEIARQEYIYSVQGNRNPFIDHPEWACHVNFTDVTYESNCSAGLSENEMELAIYPNPTADYIKIISSATFEQLTITDMSGRIVMKIDNPTAKIDVRALSKGVYVIALSANNQTIQQMIVKK